MDYSPDNLIEKNEENLISLQKNFCELFGADQQSEAIIVFDKIVRTCLKSNQLLC